MENPRGEVSLDTTLIYIGFPICQEGSAQLPGCPCQVLMGWEPPWISSSTLHSQPACFSQSLEKPHDGQL